MRMRGFTLLEVLVAMAIFALAGLALGKAMTSHLQGIDELKTQTFAGWVASNQLSELQRSKQWPPKNNQKGSVKMADTTWYWRHIVSETAEARMRMVEIQVSRDESFGDIDTRLSSFVVSPQ